MSDLRKAAEMALEALEEIYRTGDTQAFDLCYAPNVIPALRQAIAEAEQPDLARVGEVGVWGEWVGLTDEEAAECWSTSAVQTWKHIEAKLKEKNT